MECSTEAEEFLVPRTALIDALSKCAHAALSFIMDFVPIQIAFDNNSDSSSPVIR